MYKEIRELGLNQAQKITLRDFKIIINSIKSRIDMQYNFRERMENIIKYNLSEKNEFEFKYLCCDFYASF